jgi:3-dehydroquinate dehydratase II
MAQARTRAGANRTVYFLNGPNANLYGHTAGAVYGTETFEDLGKRCERKASALALTLAFRQSNHEGEIVDWIQEAIGEADGIVINGAGLTYTSIAILDALLAFPGPIVEVHMSNIYRREPFRHHSYISKAATGIIAGLGADGYELALEAMRRVLDRPEAKK